MTKEELLQIAKPILFNIKMVKAILDGRKSCTRRVIKYKNNTSPNATLDDFAKTIDDWECVKDCCQYHVGDILWVRESCGEGYEKGTYIYRADDKLADLITFKASTTMLYRPSIHMPKEAARIFLRVTDVQVERLQEITTVGIRAEGIYECFMCANENCETKPLDEVLCGSAFIDLWNSTVKKQDIEQYGWNANPFVWVIEFEKVEVDESNSRN